MEYRQHDSFINARELALMSEERWLIENLMKLRHTRNSLKVEHLYFHGLKADLFRKHYAANYGSEDERKAMLEVPVETEFEPIPKPVGSMTIHNGNNDVNDIADVHNAKDKDSKTKKNESDHERSLSSNMNQLNTDDFNIQEETCNDLELQDLNVIPNNNQNVGMDLEYESEEEEEWDQVDLEMGMLVGNELD